MSGKIIKKYLITASIVIVFLSGCKESRYTLQVRIDEIGKHFVPDSRLGIFHVQVSGKESSLILRGETTVPAARNEIIKTLGKEDKKLIDSILILPDTIENKKYMGLVTLSVINLRKNPAHAAELVSQAIMGSPVMIIKKKDNWYEIQTPDSYLSWTESTSVVPESWNDIRRWQRSHRVIYLDNTGWIYGKPSEKSGITGDIVGGCILQQTGESGGFVSVVLPDGRCGFLEKGKVMDVDLWKSKTTVTEDKITALAETYLGVPYMWGGTSPKGVDCSGFVQSVFFRNGLILQRDASLQALHGSVIDISDNFIQLNKGDLLFFGSRRSDTDHVTHVAIFLGDKDYINSSGRVMINSIDSAKADFDRDRLSRLLVARRIIGNESGDGIVPVNKHPWY